MGRIVVKSRISGEYNGWSGETIYQLENGSIWKQDRYRYHYHYAYRPAVTIIEDCGRTKMYVDGDGNEGQEVRKIG